EGSGCDRGSPPKAPGGTAKTLPAGASGSQPAGSAQPESEQPAGVDRQDASDAPRALPRSGTIAGWTKSRAVQLHSSEDALSAVSDDRLRAAMKLFRFNRVATCEYQSAAARAVVTYVEAPPFDALGLFTVMTPDPRPSLR